MQTSSAASRVRENINELFEAQLAPGDAYIKFQLTLDITALLSMEQVQESSIVEAEQITPLPSMPKSCIGMMNSRDRVFCIFDLAELLSLPSKSVAPRQYQIIILQTKSQQPIYIGLAVSELQGILRRSLEQFQLPPLDTFAANLIPFLKGAVVEEKKIIPVLEFDRILQTLTTANN